MKFAQFLFALLGALSFLTIDARSEALRPTWEIHDLCAMPNNDECLRVENAARLSVLARWATVPEADRVACMKKIDQDNRRSYRALADCFDDRAMKALEAGPAGLAPK